MQLPDVIHGPSFIVIVVVRDGGEAAGPVLVRDPALRKVLHGPRAADAVFWNSSWNISGVEVLTFKYFHIGEIRSL